MIDFNDYCDSLQQLVECVVSYFYINKAFVLNTTDQSTILHNQFDNGARLLVTYRLVNWSDTSKASDMKLKSPPTHAGG